MAAKRATKTAKKTPKAPEPFFRPFARLAASEPKPKKSSAPAPAAKHPAKHVPAPRVDVAVAIDLSGVRALPGRAARIPLTTSRIESERPEASSAPLPDLDQPARAQLRSLITEGVRFETTDDGDRVEGRRLDVDPRELRRLRRTQYAIDGKLDLHGHGVDEARVAVETFVKKRAEAGDKVVAKSARGSARVAQRVTCSRSPRRPKTKGERGRCSCSWHGEPNAVSRRPRVRICTRREGVPRWSTK
jgi:hypothetical protein